MNPTRMLRVELRAGLFLLCALFMTGCLETETTTVVQSDGSLTRSVSIKADSSGMAAGLEMFGLDSVWSLELSGADQREQTITAKRTFASADAMTPVLTGAPGRKITIKPRLTKSFNWFFTAYRYEETWAKLNPSDVVPVSDFLSKAEIDAFEQRIAASKSVITPGDSLGKEDSGERFNKWNSRNSFEEYFGLLKEGIRSLADPNLTESMVEKEKEACFAKAENFDWVSGNLGDLERTFAQILGTPLVTKAADANRQKIDGFRKRLEFQQSVLASSHKVRVVMPGLITATNAGGVEGSSASWEGFIAMTYIGDYTMWVEAREVNWWTIAVSGVVVLGLAGLAIFGVFRRKRRPQE